MQVGTTRMPTIIPVAGGKGGIGKSLFTACLAKQLAADARVCTAVDLDLGGSNLHSFFGFDNIHPGVGDFLVSKGKSLDDFVVKLPDSMNAGFVPGDGLRPFLANITHGHKMRLLRDLTRMDADIVLLDLGAGSSYNTLDFFRVWGRGILLTSPEYPAIMNMMSFAKNVVLRFITKGCQGNTFMEEIAKRISQQAINEETQTVPELLTEMAAINADRTERIRQQLASLRIDLVVNQVREPADLQFVRRVQAVLQKRLGININWQGSLFDQKQAKIGWQSPKGGGNCPSLTGIEAIAGRIVRGEVVSNDSLLAEAQELFSAI